jgi:hypothetical protein
VEVNFGNFTKNRIKNAKICFKPKTQNKKMLKFVLKPKTQNKKTKAYQTLSHRQKLRLKPQKIVF